MLAQRNADCAGGARASGPRSSGPARSAPARRLSPTNLSAALSMIDTQAKLVTSGGRFSASATNEMTGSSTAGRRNGYTAVSISIVGRKAPASSDRATRLYEARAAEAERPFPLGAYLKRWCAWAAGGLAGPEAGYVTLPGRSVMLGGRAGSPGG
jgi:hypothetical protein